MVKAKTRAKEDKVEAPAQKLFSDGKEEYYKVSVKEPPVEGKANKAIIKLLAKHFKVSQSEISLISGASSKIKTFEIL